MFGHRSPVPPDPELLDRVSGDEELDLGSYPEAALAVLGIDPRHGSPGKRPTDYASPFSRLSSPAREAAMRAELDRLIAEGTVQLPAGSSTQLAIRHGLHGRLKLSGQLGTLGQLAYWCRRHRPRIKLVVTFEASDGLRDVPVPGGLRLPAVDTCYCLPRHRTLILTERADNLAGTVTYTLRTVAQEFKLVDNFLFADVTKPGDSLMARAEMVFRSTIYGGIPAGAVAMQLTFRRDHGEHAAASAFSGASASVAGVRPTEPRTGTYPHGRVALALMNSFAAVAAET